MEACYAEGSKSRGDEVPQISFRPFTHQNCIRREPIVATTRDDSGQSFGIDYCYRNGSMVGLIGGPGPDHFPAP